MKSQTGGFLGAIVPFLTKTILPALGTLGLCISSGAISGATNKATSGHGLYRTGDVSGYGVYRTGDGLLPVMMDKNTVGKIIESISAMERLGVIKQGSLKQAMKDIEGQQGGFLDTLLATLGGSVLPSIIGGLSG